ncbi:site-specific recombinase, phage integrase family [Leptospira yanagawae serovar Saopaulo str. Sao Paulo = ATCC 700523]|uniref:Site-specific recombinase, phage integrase family n=1 Tax=Leptospira yanagawae serovar Saopaulo str. Sao Paulo = ATCC 700523 TaxID=1249483 RepID=A0A5E8HJE4_9LEPT|nr:site-specific integrase [Leptospira yanagawae]EOQ90738.1 site-specific recombinase, phage integrase family [Leptospira yanagawae serovar Saopaulo str. Sao Paulo = ATCC 700523]
MNSSNVIKISDYKRTGSKKPPRRPREEGVMLSKGLSYATMKDLANEFKNPKTEIDYRNRAIFGIMSTTGLRAREVVGLKFSSVFNSPEEFKLAKYRKKGGGWGIVVLNPEAMNFVAEYHSYIGIRSDYFFLSLPEKNRKSRHPITTRTLQNIVKSWNKVTVSGRTIHPHSIRHAVAQRVMDMYGSIATQKLLAHASPITTANYYTKPYFNATDLLVWN